MKVTLKLSIILAVAVVLALGFGHDIWAASFSDSSTIIKEFASVTPLLVISIVVDSIQGILSGNLWSIKGDSEILFLNFPLKNQNLFHVWCRGGKGMWLAASCCLH